MKTKHRPKTAPARRGRAVAVSESGLFKGRPGLRSAYESALFSQEAARLIRQMRETAGINQTELAERLGVSQPRVARLEKPTSGDGPSYAMVRRVAVACKIDWAPPRALAKQI